MTSRRTAVILNPAAAGGRALKTIPAVTSALSRRNVEYSLHITIGTMDAWNRATEYANAGYEHIIAVGGDGTFNEVVNGIQNAENNVPFSVVPAGTGCDFPRTIGVSTDVGRAIDQAVDGTQSSIDLGWAECAGGQKRFFLNVAGLGFDATVADRAARTNLPGGAKVSYLGALASSLAKYQNIAVEVQADGNQVSTRAVFVTVANAKYFGGGFNITPMAEITDGKLDLAIIGDIGVSELLRQIPNVYRGKHTSHPKFTHIPAERIDVSSPDIALVQVDGEIIGSAPVSFEIRPSAALLIV